MQKIKNTQTSFSQKNNVSGTGISADNLPPFAMENGMLNTDDVLNAMNKKRKQEIIRNHRYKISQMKGKDGRWSTYVPDATKKSGRKSVARTSYDDLIDYLCEFYGSKEQQEKEKRHSMTLADIYPDWLEYKKLHTTASTYISRIKSDWKTYYEGTAIVLRPVKQLTKLELDQWVHAMVKDHDMTRKCYTNVQMIMRQSLEYAVDLGILEFNPMLQVKVDRKMFRRDTHEVVEHTKSDDGDRQVYLTEKARRIIQTAKQSHGYPDDGYIFALSDQIIPQRCINSLLKKYCMILDIPYWSSHKNRKSCGSALLNNGMSINTVRKMLGHADEETTLKYYCYDQSLSTEKEQIFENALG